MKLLKHLGYFFGRKDAQGFPVRFDEWGKEVLVAAKAEYEWEDVKDPITRKQVIAWLKALRSGKFNQTSSVLKFEDKDGQMCHCCLGVLADIDGKIVKEENEDYDPDYNDGEPTHYYNFITGNDSVLQTTSWSSDDYDHYLPEELQKKYYRMNDNQGKSFSEIADEIAKDFGIF